jgi:hypothetical protein
MKRTPTQAIAVGPRRDRRVCQSRHGGSNPHDDTPNIPAARQLKDEFWHPGGAIEDPRGATPRSAPIPPENAD